MTPEIKELLSKFDEPGAYEFPSGFDYERLERKARNVAIRLERELGEGITFAGAEHNQDATFCIEILLRSYQLEDSRGWIKPCLRFSNFGDLVTLCWEEQIPDERVLKICQVVIDGGFHYVPSSDLDDPYDGVMAGKFDNWWSRYFDWT